MGEKYEGHMLLLEADNQAEFVVMSWSQELTL